MTEGISVKKFLETGKSLGSYFGHENTINSDLEQIELVEDDYSDDD